MKPTPTPEMIDVDALSNEIRRVDGNHTLGAGALAEALMPFLSAALSVPSAAVVGEPVGEALKKLTHLYESSFDDAIPHRPDWLKRALAIVEGDLPDVDLDRGIAAILSDERPVDTGAVALFNRSIYAAKKRVEAIRLVNRLRGLVSYPVSTEIDPKGWAWHMSPDAPEVIMETLDALSAALGGKP